MNRLTLPAAALALVAATACAGGDAATDVTRRRTVDVTMSDIKFEPATLSVAKGEAVTFRFTNTGQLPHDAFVGDTAAQQEHEREMSAEPGGHPHGSGDQEAVTVQPGRTGELTHTFAGAGTFEVGCHQPGHYAAGMKIVVTVT
ncbi:MAG TPA: plastocyanin/azurin family copper-binding protein [Frankiaceae bacterium]|nr:plastocyanin/azurin family copper-binding protein [Frankiaceae bacterium]